MSRTGIACLWAALLALALSSAFAAEGEGPKPPPPPPPVAEEPGEKEPTPEELAKLNARVAALVKELGSDEWAKREAAGEELLKIGKPAESALAEAADKAKDPEVATRAGELVKKIRTMRPKRPGKKPDPKCTDGYMPVSDGVRLVQTFKAPADKLDTLRFRAARTRDVPADDLTVELRAAGRKDGEPLASAKAQANWTDENGNGRGVTRYYQWYTLELKAEKLEKGASYELVFASAANRAAPWLVNCFYRDTYPDGELLLRAEGKETRPGKFDLAFEALAGKEDQASSVPKDADLSRKDEHFGVGHDGTDLEQKADEGEAGAKAGFL